MIGLIGKGQAVLESRDAGGEVQQGARYFALPCTHFVQGFGIVAEPDISNEGSPDEFTPFSSNTWGIYTDATFVRARSFDNPLWRVPTIGSYINNSRIIKANIQSAYTGMTRSIRFRYNTANINPATRDFKIRISDPGEVVMLVFFSENNSGVIISADDTQWVGDLGKQLVQFPNCKAVLIARQAITKIDGWPANLEMVYLRNLPVLTSIARFPKTMKHISWNSANNLDASFYNDAMQDCADLEDLYFAMDSGYPNTFGFGPTGITGTLDLTGKDKLKVITMTSSPLITWILPAVLDNIEIFDVRNSNLNDSNKAALQTILTNGKIISFWTDQNNNINWNKDFTDVDFGDTLKWFAASRTGISGNVTLTTPKPNIIHFWMGNQSTASGNSNVLSIVDVSGLTGVVKLDLSGCDIQTLNLPVTNSMSILYLMGNRLSVLANPNLVNQIRACVGLTDLRLGSGSNVDGGQNSADGFGNNLNVDTLVNLTTFVADSCKLTGKVTLPNVARLTTIQGQSNPALEGFNNLAAHGATIVSINIDRCDIIQLPELNTMAKVNSLYGRFSGLTSVDLSGRNDTVTPIGQMLVNDCPNLVSITFPSTLGAAKCSLDLHGFNNPTLSVINNMENVEYTHAQATFRRWHFSNCPLLNVTFPFGVNGFLPGSIQIQNNNMSQANVDATINSVYQNRGKNWGTGVQYLNIAGTNSAPSGILQPPAGFVLGANDGNPVSAKEQVYVLVNNYGWNVVMN
ncbi:MAG TPA: hypothetical protein PLV21_05980 [Cyclobacteriaceae bacterium]|nr:hypothetical protein [Cyclobacteriaceae bacterium]HRJ81409.1 hypothetical protein [Cyclobacteriaceae bacterium]